MQTGQQHVFVFPFKAVKAAFILKVQHKSPKDIKYLEKAWNSKYLMLFLTSVKYTMSNFKLSSDEKSHCLSRKINLLNAWGFFNLFYIVQMRTRGKQQDSILINKETFMHICTKYSQKSNKDFQIFFCRETSLSMFSAAPNSLLYWILCF